MKLGDDISFPREQRLGMLYIQDFVPSKVRPSHIKG